MLIHFVRHPPPANSSGESGLPWSPTITWPLRPALFLWRPPQPRAGAQLQWGPEGLDEDMLRLCSLSGRSGKCPACATWVVWMFLAKICNCKSSMSYTCLTPAVSPWGPWRTPPPCREQWAARAPDSMVAFGGQAPLCGARPRGHW